MIVLTVNYGDGDEEEIVCHSLREAEEILNEKDYSSYMIIGTVHGHSV